MPIMVGYTIFLNKHIDESTIFAYVVWVVILLRFVKNLQKDLTNPYLN